MSHPSTVTPVANILSSTSTTEAPLLDSNTVLSPQEKLARRDSLEKSLAARPDMQDLKNRNILLNTTAAPALQAAQLELERKRVTDELRKGLDKRPERDELVGKNILPEGSGVAPGLASAQRDLQKHMRKDSLERALGRRPTPAELVREGILERDEVPEGVVIDDEADK